MVLTVSAVEEGVNDEPFVGGAEASFLKMCFITGGGTEGSELDF